MSLVAPTYSFIRQFTNPGAVTLLQIKANAAKPIEIIRAEMSQESVVTSGQCGVALLIKTAAATVTIGAVTDFKKHNPSGANTTVTLATNGSGYLATVEGTDGDILVRSGFNTLSGWCYLPVPEERFIIPAAGIVALKLFQTPPTAIYNLKITFREIG